MCRTQRRSRKPSTFCSIMGTLLLVSATIVASVCVNVFRHFSVDNQNDSTSTHTSTAIASTTVTMTNTILTTTSFRSTSSTITTTVLSTTTTAISTSTTMTPSTTTTTPVQCMSIFCRKKIVFTFNKNMEISIFFLVD